MLTFVEQVQLPVHHHGLMMVFVTQAVIIIIQAIIIVFVIGMIVTFVKQLDPDVVIYTPFLAILQISLNHMKYLQ